MLSRCYEDILVRLAGSGSTLLAVEQEDQPDSPGIQEGSHSPSRQSGSAPAHQASRRGEAPLGLSGIGHIVVLRVESHPPVNVLEISAACSQKSTTECLVVEHEGRHSPLTLLCHVTSSPFAIMRRGEARYGFIH